MPAFMLLLFKLIEYSSTDSLLVDFWKSAGRKGEIVHVFFWLVRFDCLLLVLSSCYIATVLSFPSTKKSKFVDRFDSRQQADT